MYGTYLSAEGANTQAKRLEFISNNLANLDTPGFKRDIPSFQARFAEAIQQGADYPQSGSINDVGGGVKLMEVDTDFSHSTLRETKVPTDFAINGDGFFRVRNGEGQEFLTRAGNFKVDLQGRLTTEAGRFVVLTEAGADLKLDSTLPWEVLSGGVITQQGQTQAIGLTKPQSLGDLVKVGNNAFRSLGPTEEVPADKRDIRQGYLELSGVSSTREMMAMIETSRAFEANTQLIQHQDSMLGTLISRVLTS